MQTKEIIKRACYLLGVMPFLVSCASYTSRMQQYQSQLYQHNFSAGIHSIEKNKILKKSRNKLLQEMELGRLHQLSGNLEQSNQHLNTADQIMESNFRSFKDVAVGNLVNPMMETFKGEDFEKLAVNYFKGINYCTLGLTDEAVVEARRITLANNRLAEKYGANKEKHYYSDPFALNVQGLLYEQAGDWNNAFIAYRNAVEIYTKGGGSYFGVAMPEQLKQDLLHAAYKTGFSEEVQRYESIWNIQRKQRNDSLGDLVLFIEQGHGPVKEQYVFTVFNDGMNVPMRYTDPYGNPMMFSFNHRQHGISDKKITDIRTIRVALPFYRPVTPTKQTCVLSLNQLSLYPETVQDYNTLAISVLQDRFLQELTKAVIRYLVKTAISTSLEKGTEAAAKEQAKDEKDAEKKKKKEEDAKALGKVVGFLLNTAGAMSEQADTRTWISLPAYVSYVRIPLQSASNQITINAGGSQQSMTIAGKPGTQVRAICIP